MLSKNLVGQSRKPNTVNPGNLSWMLGHAPLIRWMAAFSRDVFVQFVCLNFKKNLQKQIFLPVYLRVSFLPPSLAAFGKHLY